MKKIRRWKYYLLMSTGSFRASKTNYGRLFYQNMAHQAAIPLQDNFSITQIQQQ
jgi:hypothetical protein